MQRTRIEWVKNQDGTQGYTINPVKGLCPVGCPYCYARRMYKRFKWDETIRFDEYGFTSPLVLDGSKVFVGSTMELFGDWIKPEWMKRILNHCKANSGVTFIFLTKRPENLAKWSPFPDNCWVGVSATNKMAYIKATGYLFDIEAKVKFISFEPLLTQIPLHITALENSNLNWLLIGQQTPISVRTTPKIEWIKEIVDAADKAGIPVFLKDNLRPLFFTEEINPPGWALKAGSTTLLRQEIPEANK